MLINKTSIRNNAARILLFVISVTIVLSVCLPTFANAEGTKVNTVKVGYYENEVFQEGAEDGAIKKGYAYEYYRKISEYTGWKYEYVYGEYSDLYNMLLDGKIDLLAGLAWKEERVDYQLKGDRRFGQRYGRGS